MNWDDISYRFRKTGFTVVEWIFILAVTGYVGYQLWFWLTQKIPFAIIGVL